MRRHRSALLPFPPSCNNAGVKPPLYFFFFFCQILVLQDSERCFCSFILNNFGVHASAHLPCAVVARGAGNSPGCSVPPGWVPVPVAWARWQRSVPGGFEVLPAPWDWLWPKPRQWLQPKHCPTPHCADLGPSSIGAGGAGRERAAPFPFPSLALWLCTLIFGFWGAAGPRRELELVGSV